MKRASIFTVVLMASASGLLACTDTSARANQVEAQTAGPSTAKAVAATPDVAPDNVIVYYFHGTRRCPTCLGIQETIAKTVRERFAAETASATLAFREVNTDEPENRHFAKDFNLGFSTMVVTANKGNATLKWEDFSQVWEYAHDPEALSEYTEKSVRAYLAMLKGK